ncbi:YraN family protein [Microbacterium sp. JZ31]|uniref:YraN family protein n=1 Tax=Microbacterium sp. JZ31 TaxID=1906274 RepID=UPI0019320578|nr:YraN family protein [Microbacterium sp. JZ31]
MARKDELGRAGEDRAASYLRGRGYEILDRNWRCPDGEIDIVAACGDRVVAVEVKTRSGIAYGHPFSAIDDIKLARMWRLALAWAAAHPDAVRRGRMSVDAIAVLGRDPRSGTLEHLEGLR